MIRLNIEIPFAKISMSSSSLFWYDLKAKKIYIGYSLKNREGLKNSKGNVMSDTVAMLDLEKKEWRRLGSINNLVRERASRANNLGSSPWGQLIHSNQDDRFYILSYADNTIFILNSDKSHQISQLLMEESLLFFRDSTLFIGTTIRKSLDSIPLHLKDFTSLNEPVYYPMKQGPLPIVSGKNNLLMLTYVLITIVFILLGIIFIRERKINKELAATKSQLIHPDSKSNNSEIFDQREQGVIYQVFQNSRSGKTTSIDDLNKTLGLSQKRTELQKKHRSDIIISINKKFRFITNSKDLLIIKKRSDHDKRSFEYYVEYDKIDGLKGILNKSI